jgi:GAF domain-containing protein
MQANDPLAEAQRTIARQQEEIEGLRRRLGDERFAVDLRDALCAAAAAGTIAAPVTHSRLLEMIVETAADVINANAASLFLIDFDTEELIFEVALGEKAEEVKKFRVPVGKGVAGLVALTGQPMAIADTEQDNRDAADIAQAIGYVPKNILCVPLHYNEQVIGVLELLDKQDAASFSPEDMSSLGLFANQAAVAIEQSRTQQNLGAMLAELVQAVDGIPDDQKQGLEEQARAFTDGLARDPAYRRGVELARLVGEIVRGGDREAQACETILRGFADYLRSRSAAMDELGWGGEVR